MIDSLIMLPLWWITNGSIYIYECESNGKSAKGQCFEFRVLSLYAAVTLSHDLGRASTPTRAKTKIRNSTRSVTFTLSLLSPPVIRKSLSDSRTNILARWSPFWAGTIGYCTSDPFIELVTMIKSKDDLD
jgi:hypothetical protein